MVCTVVPIFIKTFVIKGIKGKISFKLEELQNILLCLIQQLHISVRVINCSYVT